MDTAEVISFWRSRSVTHRGLGWFTAAVKPGRIFMLTGLLLPPSPGGRSHRPSLRLISPLMARLKRKGGEGNEEWERGRRRKMMISRCCIIGIRLIALTFTHIQNNASGAGPRGGPLCLLMKIAAIYLTYADAGSYVKRRSY